MIAPKYSITNDNISVFWDGEMHTVQKGTPNYDGLRRAIFDEDWGSIPKYLTVEKAVEEWSGGDIQVQDDKVVHKGQEMPKVLGDRVMAMSAKGQDSQAVIRFWERVQNNPQPESVAQLWEFLQHHGIPLTDRGTFLAYKGVNRDYTDCHTGKIDNHPGKLVKMPRHLVSYDPKTACHRGLHVGAIGYARNFGARTIICEVDPEHVVSVPEDHNAMKMRVCEYKVVGNYGVQLDDLLHEEPVEITTTEIVDLGEPDHGLPVVKDPAPVVSTKQEKAKPAPKAPQTEWKRRRDLNDPPATLETWQEFDKQDVPELMENSITILRKYASSHLHVLGAYRIPGGKVALVAAIQDTRTK